MIIVPEIQTVVLLAPKTGSGSLRKAIFEKYPEAMELYRHMEACGIPKGYEHWAKVGVARWPMARLWGLYKFLQKLDGPYDEDYMRRMRESVDTTFSDWVLNNKEVFTSPYGVGRIQAKYMVNHHIPETRKSQYLTLRPDLGTEIYQFDDLFSLSYRLDVTLPTKRHHFTDDRPVPEFGEDVAKHVEHHFEWDVNFTGGLV